MNNYRLRISLRILLVLLTHLCCRGNSFCQTFLDKSQWDLFYLDEFNGATSDLPTSYTINLDGVRAISKDLTPSTVADWKNLYCSGGLLHMKVSSEPLPVIDDYGNPHDYTSAVLATKFNDEACAPYDNSINNDGGLHFGMFEIRAKLCHGNGMYSTFWLYGRDMWPPEYDVFEYRDSDLNPDIFVSTHSIWNFNHTSTNVFETVTISPGTHTFNIGVNLGLSPGQKIIMFHDNLNYMIGTLESYDNVTGSAVFIVDPNSAGCITYATTSNYGTCNYAGYGNTFNSWNVDGIDGGEDKSHNHCITFHDKILPIGWDQDWHTYTFVWTPNEISWFIDGKEIRTDNAITRLNSNSCINGNMDVVISLVLNSPNYLEGLDFEEEYLIDYLRVYKPNNTNSSWQFKAYSELTPDLSNHVLLSTAPNNVSDHTNDNLSLHPTANNVYYKGTSGMACNFYWSGAGWVYAPINSTITNVNSDLTYDPVNSRLYYRTASNGLRYFITGVGYGTGISNCYGDIVSDIAGKVLYRGPANTLWNYYYNTSTSSWQSVELNSSVKNCSGPIMPNATADKMFYVATDKNIWYVEWVSGSWSAPTQITYTSNVSSEIVYDNARNKFYFKETSSNSMYNCWWDGSTYHVDLLTTTLEPKNVNGSLALDKTNEILYYVGTDNRLWYFFHDKGWGTGYGQWFNYITDWNLTNVSGPIVVRNDGAVFYVGSDNRIYGLSWNNGNILNPECDNEASDNMYIYKADAREVAPSDSLFELYTGDNALVINNGFTDPVTLELEIISIDGKRVYEKTVYAIPGHSKIQFDLPLDNGLYLYRASSINFERFGKLIVHD